VSQDDDEAEEAEDSQHRAVDNYTGVAIKVRNLSHFAGYI
jgi:hypothetical protein